MNTDNLKEFAEGARKFLVALAAALAILAIALADGVTASEWVQIGLAFLGALGVYQIKNEER